MQLVQQYSYVSMFSMLFPLGGLMSVMRSALEANSDAYTMFRSYRRPIPLVEANQTR